MGWLASGGGLGGGGRVGLGLRCNKEDDHSDQGRKSRSYPWRRSSDWGSGRGPGLGAHSDILVLSLGRG